MFPHTFIKFRKSNPGKEFFQKILLDFYLFCVSACFSGDACITVCVCWGHVGCGSEDSLEGFVLSFHNEVPRFEPRSSGSSTHRTLIKILSLLTRLSYLSIAVIKQYGQGS